MAIISTANFKSFKGISASTWDTQLDLVIPAAQDMAERWCGRKFDSATYTDQKYDGPGASSIQLKNFPVTTLTSIKYVNAEGDTTTIDSTSYTCDLNTGVVKFEPAWNGRLVTDPELQDYQVQTFVGDYPQFIEGHQTIAVTYTAGYDAGSMPASLKLAMVQFVDFLMGPMNQTIGSGQFKSERLGDYNYDRGTLEAQANEQVMARFFSLWRVPTL